MSAFRFLPEAEADLQEICDFISRDSPDAADRVREELYEVLSRLLVAFPSSGHRREDLTRLPLRFWNVRNYLIAYATEDSAILVVAILHGSRDPATLAAIPSERDQ